MQAKSIYNESELLEKIANGDQRAFQIIYDRYRPKVYTLALRILKSDILAEEVMQETMLKLWQVAATVKIETTLEPYLKTLARNRSYNVLRRQVLEAKAAVEMGLNWTELMNETEEQIILDETRKLLAEAIALLPPQQKLVYQLCRQEGLMYEQAAQQLNLSTHTVKSYMKLALHFLRNYLSSHTDVAALIVIYRLLEK